MPKDVIQANFSDVTIIRNENGEYVFDEIQSTAAAADQTQPLSVEENVDAGVPRNKKVGLDQTDADYLEYEQKYERGKDNTDSKVVPRSKGDSGISGWEKTTFDDEGANKATSGNPDNYTQAYQENVKPTPAGSDENHVAKNENELETTGSINKELQKMASRLEKLEKDLQKEKTLRAREQVASKIVNLEVSANLIEATEDEIDQRIKDMALQTPVESLNRELERTKTLVSKIQRDGNTVTASINKTAGIQTGVFAGYNSQEMPALQSMFISSDIYDENKHLPKSYIQQKNNSNVDSLRNATKGTYLNRIIGG